MTLTRTMDATALNAVANHPDVRPWLGGEGPLDLNGAAQNPNNVVLVTEGGGFLLIKHEPGIYEVHTLFLPEARGPQLMGLVAEGLRFMFSATDCSQIQTKVPDGNLAAMRLAVAAGFQPMFRRDVAFTDPAGTVVGMEYLSLAFDRWRENDATLEGEGAAFHEALEAARLAAGAEWPDHPKDPAHDRAAGAASLMAKAGNCRKAVWLYNGWARLAGYPLITLASENPPVIDMSVGDIRAIVQASPSGMEVLLCR